MKTASSGTPDTCPKLLWATPSFLALILIVVTLLAYLPVRNCEFTNYDDQDYVTSNEIVKSGLSWGGLKWAFTTGHASNWHPLTWLSHMLDIQCFGLSPGAHHLTNVFLHTGATALLFLSLLRLTSAKWRSFLVAGIFALHPMHVESVAWIAERKDVLSGFFAMLTLWFYSIYATSRNDSFRKRKSVMLYGAVLISFTLGLLSKPMLVTLPFVLLLLDYWPLERIGRERVSALVAEKMPLFLLSAASSIITFIVQQKAGSVRTLDIIPVESRIFNSLISYWGYIAKLLWPAKLAVFYPMPDVVSGWMGLLSGLGLIAISFFLFVQRRRSPMLIVGWLWFVGMLIPVIGLVQVGGQSMADRYSYLPSIGFFVAIVWVVPRVTGQTIAVIGGSLVMFASIVVTEHQLKSWRNTVTLFERALVVTERNFVAHINLGSALMQRKQLDEALLHYEKAIALKEDIFEPHYGAAVILERKGELSSAVAYYRTAVELRPGAAVAHNNLGALLLRMGESVAAVEELQKAIAADPLNAEAHYNLGVALAGADKTSAISHYQKAVSLRPDYADARNNLAVVLAGAGQYEAAADQLRWVVSANPKDAEAHFNFSFVLSKLGRADESRKHYETAFRLNPHLADKR